MRYKFIDDATVLEAVDLKTVGISSYNIKQHVPSDVPTHNQWIPPESLNSQEYLNKISFWTQENKMKLNVDKTKLMIFNFSDKFQFSTRLTVGGKPLETVNKAKLLGTVITSDLSWDSNTECITRIYIYISSYLTQGGLCHRYKNNKDN